MSAADMDAETGAATGAETDVERGAAASQSADPASRSLDPAVFSPLSVFGGTPPPAPPWFHTALALAPERRQAQILGGEVELLTWGRIGQPGLLFLHGNGAHADWWSFIAPFFSQTHRVAALSWSGMGRSSWKERYSVEGFAQEAREATTAAGLHEGPAKPLIVAHSFGGSIAAALAASHGAEYKAAVIVDSGARPPEHQWRGPPRRTDPNPVYPTLSAALARFRLMPPQPSPNAFLIDYIARASLQPANAQGHDAQEQEAQKKEAPGEEAAWTWRFDPFIWSKMDFSRAHQSGEELARAQCRLAFVWGAQSSLMTPEVVEYSRRHAAFGTPFVEIPDAGHHVLLDQPLALVSTLRALFAVWS